tara:strand:+ start:648 stop:845 length:198 start_codon:yes stop_codon:yes gene_type:complete
VPCPNLHTVESSACALVALPLPQTPSCAREFRLLLSTRQIARKFNQPLNFNTSSVTNMDAMFFVR